MGRGGEARWPSPTSGRPTAGPGADDFAGALVCYKRLLAIAPDRVDVRYASVIALDRLGRATRPRRSPGRSRRPIARGIPRRTTGSPAASWRTGPGSRQRAAAAEAHLLPLPPGDAPETRRGQGDARVAVRRDRPRRPRPGPCSRRRRATEPDRLLDLARVCRALGDRAGATDLTRAAMEAARRRAEAAPDDKARDVPLGQGLRRPGATTPGRSGSSSRARRDAGTPPSTGASPRSAPPGPTSLKRSGAGPGRTARGPPAGPGVRPGERATCWTRSGRSSPGDGKEAERGPRRGPRRARRRGGRRPWPTSSWASTPGPGTGPRRPGTTGSRPTGSTRGPRSSPTTWPGCWPTASRPTCPAPGPDRPGRRAVARRPQAPRHPRARCSSRWGSGRTRSPRSRPPWPAARRRPALHADLASAYDHLGMPEMAAAAPEALTPTPCGEAAPGPGLAASGPGARGGRRAAREDVGSPTTPLPHPRPGRAGAVNHRVPALQPGPAPAGASPVGSVEPWSRVSGIEPRGCPIRGPNDVLVRFRRSHPQESRIVAPWAGSASPDIDPMAGPRPAGGTRPPGPRPPGRHGPGRDAGRIRPASGSKPPRSRRAPHAALGRSGAVAVGSPARRRRAASRRMGRGSAEGERATRPVVGGLARCRRPSGRRYRVGRPAGRPAWRTPQPAATRLQDGDGLTFCQGRAGRRGDLARPEDRSPREQALEEADVPTAATAAGNVFATEDVRGRGGRDRAAGAGGVIHVPPPATYPEVSRISRDAASGSAEEDGRCSGLRTRTPTSS